MATADWEQRNPYQVLGLEADPSLDEATIKKAYKFLSLKLHPDKNPSPNAAQEFDELQKARDVLLDKAARGALDDYLKAKELRKQRESAHDDKRRKLREELQRRERTATGERSEEELARARLKHELERLRHKAEEEQAKAATAAAAASAAAKAMAQRTAGIAGASDGGVGDVHAQLQRTLKVTWSPGIREYSSEELRAIFGAFGSVEDVVVRDRKKKGKASALVVMGSEAALLRAAGSVCGDVDAPLLVVPLLKEAGAGFPVDDDGDVLPRDAVQRPVGAVEGGGAGGVHATGRGGPAEASGAAAGLLQRPVRLPEMSGRPLFPAAAPAFPVAGAAAAFPCAGSKPAFPVGGSAKPAFPAGASATFPTGASSFPGPSSGASGSRWSGAGPGTNGGTASMGASSAFEEQILEKMRAAAERKRKAAEAGAGGDPAGP